MINKDSVKFETGKGPIVDTVVGLGLIFVGYKALRIVDKGVSAVADYVVDKTSRAVSKAKAKAATNDAPKAEEPKADEPKAEETKAKK